MAATVRRHGPAILVGLVGGAICYLLAEIWTPGAPSSAAEHDRWLTQRLGLVLAPALGLGLGWLQRSQLRALIGFGAGLLAGWFCYRLCSDAFQPILVALPILLGTLSAALCASNRGDPLRSLASRFWRGLLVGLVLGTAFIVLLGMSGPWFWPRSGGVDYLRAYLLTVWRAGPFALGLSGAMLLPALRWIAEPRPKRAILRSTDSRVPLSEAVRPLQATGFPTS